MSTAKKCSNCGRQVPIYQKAGDSCPYCKVVWRDERSLFAGPTLATPTTFAKPDDNSIGAWFKRQPLWLRMMLQMAMGPVWFVIFIIPFFVVTFPFGIGIFAALSKNIGVWNACIVFCILSSIGAAIYEVYQKR